jgi:hypothetical protein
MSREIAPSLGFRWLLTRRPRFFRVRPSILGDPAPARNPWPPSPPRARWWTWRGTLSARNPRGRLVLPMVSGSRRLCYPAEPTGFAGRPRPESGAAMAAGSEPAELLWIPPWTR